MTSKGNAGEWWIGRRVSGKFTVVEGHDIETRIIHAECDKREFASEIISNARAAKCWKACVENGWHMDKDLGVWLVLNSKDQNPPDQYNDTPTEKLVGSGPTPENAVEDALQRKGGSR